MELTELTTVDNTITCTCADDMTPIILYCDDTVEAFANHEMASAGGTTPIEMVHVPAVPTQKYDTDYGCAHTSPNIHAP